MGRVIGSKIHRCGIRKDANLVFTSTW